MPDDAPAPGPDGVPPSTAPPAPAEPKDDWETRFKYLLADFENFRRRVAKEREATDRQARAALLRELLPLLEAFRAANAPVARLPKADPLRRGFELLDREWVTFLKREGVEPVAEVGRPFQAEEAEAVGEVAADPTAADGAIREVVQQGYRFHGGLLRPAKVIVAREKPAGRAPSPEVAPGGERPEAES
jgi:molecular chaperone GrpE